MSRIEEWWVDAVLPLWLVAAALALGLAWGGPDVPPAPRPAIVACIL